MKTIQIDPSRRSFLSKSATMAAGSFFLSSIAEALVLHDKPDQKMKIALVGLGVRGVSMFGRDVQNAYRDMVEFVGLCDINEGRLRLGQKYIGVSCPLFMDFDKMLAETRPDVVIVTTVDIRIIFL